MRRSLLVLALATLPLAACAGDPPGSPYDDDFAVSSADPLLDGAPDNGSLPDENKADAIYPAQFFDLVADQSPVKSQGSRGVCSIFATTALMENLYIKAGMRDADFSEQYMQWSAKEQVRSFRTTEGSNASSNLQAASDYGIVLEQFWRYQSSPWNSSNDPGCTGGEDLPVQCYTNGAPPQDAVEAQKFKLPRGRYLNTNSIKAHLTSKKSGVVVGMTFFYQSWNHRRSALPVSSAYWREGIVLAPNAQDRVESLKKRAGHAILIVGWDDDKEVAIVDEAGEIVKDADGNPVTEKGFWIFKNSWGTGSFGVANPHGDGYGYLSMKYVSEFGTAYVSDVPTVTTAEICDNGTDDDHDGQTDCDDSQCATAPACQAQPTEHVYSATPGVAIPDNDPIGVASTLAVTDAGTVGTAKVTVSIDHTYRGDLRVVLRHDGREVLVHDRTGGYEDDLDLTIDAPALAGAALAGDWTLTVSDNARADTGTLTSWSVAVVTAP
ncbi:MAG: proprotein convertase P-domain-containing protein [Myxococcales bacterium]|nr:proprotein convertase P-domain-containing protein [Myxococcales bacterium]